MKEIVDKFNDGHIRLDIPELIQQPPKTKREKRTYSKNQILDSISDDNYNVEESLEYQEDLADTVENKVELKHNHVEERSEVEKNVIEELSEVNNIVPKYNSSGPIPYEGNEFSYI